MGEKYVFDTDDFLVVIISWINRQCLLLTKFENTNNK